MPVWAFFGHFQNFSVDFERVPVCFRPSNLAQTRFLAEISSMRPSVDRYDPGNMSNSKSMTPKKRDFFRDFLNFFKILIFKKFSITYLMGRLVIFENLQNWSANAQIFLK